MTDTNKIHEAFSTIRLELIESEFGRSTLSSLMESLTDLEIKILRDSMWLVEAKEGEPDD